jgi:FtsZ-interacting cell division protein ZipA
MGMAVNTTDFLANTSFVDQTPSLFGGSNMKIKA